MAFSLSRFQQNLHAVRLRIAAAGANAGRAPEEIKLIAVTKYVSADTARAMVEAGCRQLGESRPQDLWEKADALRDCNVQWHFIGHLQRNKARRTVPLVDWIHSVDRLSLLDEVEKLPLPRPVNALVEINVSGDSAKHGLPLEEAEPFLAAAVKYQNVTICGLMTMAARESDLALARRNFSDLRELRDRLQRQFAGELRLDQLSMGMSGDFEVAIEEGATMVRVGSALFDEMNP